MPELALPMYSRGRRELLVDAVAALGALVLAVVGVGGSDDEVLESLLQVSAVVTVCGLAVHRFAGHSRIALYDDRVEVRNPGLTAVIPRGEVVAFTHARGNHAPVVQLRDGKTVSCAAALPDQARRVSLAYTRPPNIPRGPVRHRLELCVYEWVWLAGFAAVASAWLVAR